MRLSLYSLRLFVSVVDEGTIAKAAEREHIASSALSKRISELEQSLGTPLLVRLARGVQPTIAGSVLAKGARLLLRNAEDLADEIEHFASGLSGQVRVAANLSSITQFLAADLGRFCDAHPFVRVDLEEQVSDEVVRLVSANAADIGIYSLSDKDHELETFPYRTDRMVMVVPDTHPLASRESVSFAETLDYPHVGMHPGSAANALLMRHASDLHRQIQLRFQVTSYDAMIAMIKAGMGIGMMPNHSISLYSIDRMKILQLDDNWAARQLRLCVRSTESLTPAGRLLLDSLCSDDSPA
ncbi:LysR family transcriptional regulator [Paraburkholderia sp. Ac-20340]|uniref:LysR family transcriptional regulator n=1 Tax=Paraburkholderia sp. Ac-20340 TaxID=2703888 RepID=UPI00197D7A9C|nr:LysR family transcriptional regulator [Paraburkholderia sp. Ac-20340]MBN3858919.1 LysR family transcriptional regulator [Paraburkholderia sp. Ac-20340]